MLRTKSILDSLGRDVDKLDPHVVEMTEVLVRRQERSLALMSGRRDPKIILGHGDSRFWRGCLPRRSHRFSMSPSVDERVRAHNGFSADVERRKSVQNILKSGSSSLPPAILFRQGEKLAFADDGCKDHRFLISKIELPPNPESPWCRPDKTEQHARIQQETFRHRTTQSS